MIHPLSLADIGPRLEVALGMTLMVSPLLALIRPRDERRLPFNRLAHVIAGCLLFWTLLSAFEIARKAADLGLISTPVMIVLAILPVLAGACVGVASSLATPDRPEGSIVWLSRKAR